MTLRQINPLFLTALLSTLVGCPNVGCTNGAKFTPAQIQSVRELTDVATEAAKQNNVTVQGRVRLKPIDFYAKQSVGVDGLEAELYFTANPAAQNAADNARTSPSPTPVASSTNGERTVTTSKSTNN